MKKKSFFEMANEVNECGYTLISHEHKKHILVCVEDVFGYRYKLQLDNLKNSKNRYFVYATNPYSVYNISLWLDKNKNNIELFEDNIYKNSLYDKMKFKCKICKKYFYMTWNNIKRDDYGCPNCSISNGEKKVEECLLKMEIDYNREHKFENCTYVKELPFDFYLPCYNLCIEYQGIQHYEPIDFLGKGRESAIKSFDLIKIKDKIKEDYCQKNKIFLLPIHYNDFDNIEFIIKNKIGEFDESANV